MEGTGSQVEAMILPIGRKPSRPGFTLIELILLTIIILVLVAVATPQFRSTFSDLELKYQRQKD